MARRREELEERVLERGEISLMYRPRVEQWQPEDVGDIQRLLLVLCPQDRARYRVIAIGRKRLPRGSKHDRFWGYVDLVLDSPTDLRAALGGQTYGTKTRGLRHLPAARPAARGAYEMTWHEDHAHLRYDLDSFESNDPVVEDLRLEQSADFLVTIANPDLTAWGLVESPPLQFDLFDETEIHVTIPTPFPQRLQSRFGDRRFVQMDTVEYLDHPGAELVFVGT